MLARAVLLFIFHSHQLSFYSLFLLVVVSLFTHILMLLHTHVHMCLSLHVEVRVQLLGVSSLLSFYHGFWGLSGCVASASFTHQAISLALNCFIFVFNKDSKIPDEASGGAGCNLGLLKQGGKEMA